MPKKIVSLTSLEDLKVFMSPVRQSILRCMYINGEPMTAKKIADCLNISPSSAAHHLSRLESLGLVELKYTGQINGITARYYTFTDVTVNIGTQIEDGLEGERIAIIQSLIKSTLDGLYGITKADIPKDELPSYGDFLHGVVHLSPADSEKLRKQIQDFLDTHATKTEDSEPWEFSLIFYNANYSGSSAK